MNKVYYKELDILKGVGIFLVVLGHLSLPTEMAKIIFNFHMPLFFFASGFVFKSKGNLEFIKDKLKRTLMPFYIFSTITFLLYYIPNFTNANLTLMDFLIGTFLGISNDHYLSWNVVLWFLPSLFFINVLFNFLYVLFKYYSYIIGFTCFLISLFLLKDKSDTFLFFHIGSALLMIPFFLLGLSLKENYFKLIKALKKNNSITIVISILFIIIGIIVSYCNNEIPDIRIHIIGNIFFFYTGAFFTILGLLVFSRFIQSKFLIWLGLNSLLIMCIHIKLRGIASKVVSFLPFDNTYGILLTILIILLCVPFAFLFNKYFPIAVGLKK